MTDTRPIVISVPEPRTLDLIFTPADLVTLRHDYRLMEAEGAGIAPLVERHIGEAAFIIGQPDLPRAQLQKAAHLKAIFNVETNFLDNMDYGYCFENGIHVLSTGRVFAVPVAEIGLGLALALERDICGADRAFRTGQERWGGDGNADARLLSGAEIGIIGFGDLGKALNRVLAGFRARIRVLNRLFWHRRFFLRQFFQRRTRGIFS